MHTDSATKSIVSNVIRPCFFFWGGGGGEKRGRRINKIASRILHFCMETRLHTWTPVAGKKPWETYQLGFTCPHHSKTPTQHKTLVEQ